jgi:pyruvate formate lyase activating enzyme
LILRNIRLILDSKIPLIVRIPLIAGINDDDESLNAMARFVSELDNKLHVDLLPYHRFGENKYKMLDKSYELIGLEPLTEEQLQKALRIFEKYRLTVALQE